MQKQVAEDIRMIFNAPRREKQRYIWQKLLRNVLRLLQYWLTGWRSISLKDSLSLLFQLHIGSEFELPIAWRGSPRKSNAGP